MKKNVQIPSLLSLLCVDTKDWRVRIPPMGIKVLIILVFFFYFINLEARPISYSGGYTLMTESNNMQDSAYYHYSPSYKYSIGIQQIKDKYFNSKYSYLRLTYLLNRRNTKNSQRNLYLQSGLSSNGLDPVSYTHLTLPTIYSV